MDIKRMVRLKYPIKSILIHECQHESTQINTSPTRVNANQHESNTNQHESDTSQRESTRNKTSATRVNTNQHESTRVRHDSIRPRNYHSLSQFQLVKYDNSLIGLNITFSHYLELGLKEIKNKLEKYLDVIQVFVNNFSLLGVNQFIYQE